MSLYHPDDNPITAYALDEYYEWQEKQYEEGVRLDNELTIIEDTKNAPPEETWQSS